jgi:hypothetical protein
MPAVRDTFVNPLLSNVYIGYSNDSYVAGQFFPTVEVNKETGTYFVRDKENLRQPADARRGEFSRANRVANGLTTAAYTLEEKSLETPISDRVMRNYDRPFDPKSNATKLVSEKLLIDKELDLQTTILAAASGSNTLDASNGWSTITTDIVGQVRTGRNTIQKATGKKANTALISKISLDSILKNTAFLDSVKYTTIVNEQNLRSALAAWFDVSRVLIGDGIYNTVKEGQTDSTDYIWTDLCVLAYVNPAPVIEDTSAGYELKLQGAAFVDEWYEQEIKTTFVRANDFYDNKVVDPGAMYIITNTTT